MQERKIKIVNQLTGDPDECLFFEQIGGVFFWSTMLDVVKAEYHLNRNFILRDYAYLNELYDFLGIPKTKAGEVLGWNTYDGAAFYGYSWIDFDHKWYDSHANDIPGYYYIHMPFAPHEIEY